MIKGATVGEEKEAGQRKRRRKGGGRSAGRVEFRYKVYCDRAYRCLSKDAGMA